MTIAVVLGATPVAARAADRPIHKAVKPAGMAWRVQGDWRVATGSNRSGDAALLRSGDAVMSGSLVQPSGLETAHSLTVLLPDGQRMLYECFTPEDCARGFRVPALIGRPSPWVVDMLTRMRRVIAETGAVPAATAKPATVRKTATALDETVVMLDSGGSPGTVRVGGLLATLPDGTYTYVQQALIPHAAPLTQQTLTKSGPLCTLPIADAGLYELLVSDAQGLQRIDLVVAAIGPRQKSVDANYKKAKAQLDEWNEKFSGWPARELLRAYLQSLMQNSSH